MLIERKSEIIYLYIRQKKLPLPIYRSFQEDLVKYGCFVFVRVQGQASKWVYLLLCVYIIICSLYDDAPILLLCCSDLVIVSRCIDKMFLLV